MAGEYEETDAGYRNSGDRLGEVVNFLKSTLNR